MQRRGPDADRLYSSIQLELSQTQEDLDALVDGHGDSETARNDVASRVNQIQRDVDQLSSLMSERGTMDDRWRERLRSVQDGYSELRSGLESFLSTSFSVASERRDRELLFAGASAGRAIDMGTVEALGRERESLRRAHGMVDEFSSWAGSLMGNLRDQKERMKSTSRRFGDFAAALGLSRSLTRAIERRIGGDRAIVLGAAVTFLLVLAMLYFFIHRNDSTATPPS